MSRFSVGGTETEARPCGEIVSVPTKRMKCGIESIDNFFSGGIAHSQIISLAGVSGCGKTTLLLQILEAYANAGYETSFASNEEQEDQLKEKCDRLKLSKVKISHTVMIDSILEMIEENHIVVIDSLQGVIDNSVKKNVEKEIMNKITAYAKEYDTAVILIMHATKTGREKGDSSIGHMVDTRITGFHGSDLFCRESPRIFEIMKTRFGKTGAMCWDMGEGFFDLSFPFFNDLYNFDRKFYKRD